MDQQVAIAQAAPKGGSGRSPRAAVLALALVACAHEPPRPAPAPPPAPPPALPFRAWLAPPPLGPVKPATAEARCVDGGPTTAHETERNRAALDAELRQRDALLLKVRALPSGSEAPVLGSFQRGPQGERWMIVGTTDDCGNARLEVGLDSSGAVFVIQPDPRVGQTRQLRLCQPWCGGVCGHAQPRRPLVVEVPPNAHLAAPRRVTYALEVAIQILPVSADGYPFNCDLP